MSDSKASATAGGEADANVVSIDRSTDARQSRPDAVENVADADWGERARQEAAHIEFDCCFHTKAQFEACAAWERWSMRLGMITAVLGVFSATALVSVLGDAGVLKLPDSPPPATPTSPLGVWPIWGKLLVAFVALVAGVATATMKFLDPKGRAALHGAAGKRYRALADEARQFRNLMVTAGIKRESLLANLAAMVKRRAEIHEAAPVLPEAAMNTTQAKAASGKDSCLKRLASEAKLPTG